MQVSGNDTPAYIIYQGIENWKSSQIFILFFFSSQIFKLHPEPWGEKGWERGCTVGARHGAGTGPASLSHLIFTVIQQGRRKEDTHFHTGMHEKIYSKWEEEAIRGTNIILWFYSTTVQAPCGQVTKLTLPEATLSGWHSGTGAKTWKEDILLVKTFDSKCLKPNSNYLKQNIELFSLHNSKCPWVGD